MKTCNALSNLIPLSYFVVAASGTVNSGDFVKLVNGYLVTCANGDANCIGRASGGGVAQLASLPTITAPNGSSQIDYTQQGYGGLVVVPVELAYPGVAYSLYALGVLGYGTLGNNYALYVGTDGTPCVNLADSSHDTFVVQSFDNLCPVPNQTPTTGTACAAITSMGTPAAYNLATATYQCNNGVSSVVIYQGKYYVAIFGNTAGTSAIAAGSGGVTVPGTASGAAYWQEVPKCMVGVNPLRFQLGGQANVSAPLVKTNGTASPYTLTAADWGLTFTTTGAAATVYFTLPVPSAALAGMTATFICTTATGMVITCTGKLVGLNGAAFNTCTFTTASNMYGAVASVVCDGSKWLVSTPCVNTSVFA